MEREEKRFAAAKKIPAAEYDDPVYWEGHLGSFGDGYFANADEVLDYCESEGIGLPAYVWACDEQKFTLDADKIIESELARQETWEDAEEQISEADRRELGEFLSAWSKKVALSGWTHSIVRAVIIDSGL